MRYDVVTRSAGGRNASRFRLACTAMLLAGTAAFLALGGAARAGAPSQPPSLHARPRTPVYFHVTGVKDGSKAGFCFNVFRITGPEFTSDELNGRKGGDNRWQPGWIEFQEDKYRGGRYTPIPGKGPTPMQDCGGYVFERLFRVGRFWTTGPEFYRLVRAFGHSVARTDSYLPGDIVVWGAQGSHVGYVGKAEPSDRLGDLVIESKDGNEAVMETKIPLLSGGLLFDPSDPLINNYGDPVIWRIDAPVRASMQFHPFNSEAECNNALLYSGGSGIGVPNLTGDWVMTKSKVKVRWQVGPIRAVPRDPAHPYEWPVQMTVVDAEKGGFQTQHVGKSWSTKIQYDENAARAGRPSLLVLVHDWMRAAEDQGPVALQYQAGNPPRMTGAQRVSLGVGSDGKVRWHDEPIVVERGDGSGGPDTGPGPVIAGGSTTVPPPGGGTGTPPDTQAAGAAYAKGDALLREGRYAEAEANLRVAAALAPGNALYRGSLGNALFLQAKYGEAEAAYRETLRRCLPADRAVWTSNLGKALTGQQKYAEAEAAFRQASELAPSIAAYRIDLGNALFSQKKYAEAEAVYRAAARLEPQNGSLQALLAAALLYAGRRDDAVRAAREAQRLGVAEHWVFQELGL